MDTMIQIKNRFNHIEAAYLILVNVDRDREWDVDGIVSNLQISCEALEKELWLLDKLIYQLVHGTPLIISRTEWVKGYRARRKAL